MKKVFSLMLLLATLMVSFTACSDDKDEPDDIKSKIIGTWDATSVKFSDSEWIDISNRPNMSLSITFHSDGSYYGRGALGNGRGTYRRTLMGNSTVPTTSRALMAKMPNCH